MPCYHPITAYRSKEKNDNGKRSLVFDSTKALHTGAKIQIPCGRCVGCRLERSRQWAMRCVHESQLYEKNCFLTLTYDDEHLPDDKSLHKEDFQLFMKRLRREFPDDKIRYYQCGEYGEENKRPHYHACLFNFDFPDKKFWSNSGGSKLYTSEILNERWQKGYCIIGDVTFESAAYVARYIMKKILGGTEDERNAYYAGREPEYTTMSRRPGIGAKWFESFQEDVTTFDHVVMRGREQRPPRYYDNLLAGRDPHRFEEIKEKRQSSIDFMVPSYGRLAGGTVEQVGLSQEHLLEKEMVKKASIKIYGGRDL